MAKLQRSGEKCSEAVQCDALDELQHEMVNSAFENGHNVRRMAKEEQRGRMAFDIVEEE